MKPSRDEVWDSWTWIPAILLLLLLPSSGAAQPSLEKVRACYVPGPDRTDTLATVVEVRSARGFGMMKEGAAVDAGEFYRASGRVIRLFRL
jgi:hypothetical protein